MDIVDAQVHVFHGMGVDECLFGMDSLGIRGVLIDEVWPGPASDRSPPYQELPGGLIRPLADLGRAASMQHPDRFRFLRRINHRDPDLATLVRQAGEDPFCLAVRAEIWEAQTRELADGAYLPLFRAATEAGLPVFALTLGNSPALEPSIAALPGCRFVIDHIGLVKTPEAFDALLALARYPNVSLKWCHANRAFDDAVFPFPRIQAALRRAIDAFGPERVMWASDATLLPPPTTWAENLFSVRMNDLLTEDERAWVLGRTVRSLLGWAA